VTCAYFAGCSSLRQRSVRRQPQGLQHGIRNLSALGHRHRAWDGCRPSTSRAGVTECTLNLLYDARARDQPGGVEVAQRVRVQVETGRRQRRTPSVFPRPVADRLALAGDEQRNAFAGPVRACILKVLR